jgi:hypothetical protein
MKYDINILPLTKENLEKFDDLNSGLNENFIDLGFKQNYKKYIESIFKNIRTYEYFTTGETPALLGGYRVEYNSPDWYENPQLPTSTSEFSSDLNIDANIAGSASYAAVTNAAVAAALVTRTVTSAMGGAVLGLFASFGMSMMDFSMNQEMANRLNEADDEYTTDQFKRDRADAGIDIKDPYIDSPEFAFIFSMFNLKMGSIIMGNQGYRRFLIEMNNLDPTAQQIDIESSIDPNALETATQNTLGQISQKLNSFLDGTKNSQYTGVVQANAAANLGFGILANIFPLNLFMTTPRFEFKLVNPNDPNDVHNWDQGSLLNLSPPWGRDCENGWDWGSCSCETVDTDDINLSMSIWDTYNTNDCDYFGKNKFDPHFSKKYPEGRYYCDSSIHQVRAYCPNDNEPRNAFAGQLKQKLFCHDSESSIEDAIGDKLGVRDWCETFPNAVKHQTCNSINPNASCKKQLIREGDAKLNIDYKEVGFSADPRFINRNFPVPPILHYTGGAYHSGMGDENFNECPVINADSDRYEIEITNRTELGNHLFYKYSANNTDTRERCASVNDKKCNPCHGVPENQCGRSNNRKYSMCEWTNGKCKPLPGYQVNFNDTPNPRGSFFDASFKIEESIFDYDLDQDRSTPPKKHPRYNQYAKYIDCRRHGLEDFQCYNPSIMSHLEKWCDALGIADGLESWNDDSFSTDYRYQINRIDMIPDAFTDYTTLDLTDRGNPVRKYKSNWIGLQKPRPLGYEDWQIAPWEKKWGGFHGHTDAMPGGNFAEINMNSERDRLLFLNRGYCPTRFYEDGSPRYPTRELNNYDDEIGFGYGRYSPHSHKEAGQLESNLTGANPNVCHWLNYRANQHSRVLSEWLQNHNLFHKINPAFGLINESLVGSSRCTMASVNSAINKMELCRRYGIGGKDEFGQVFFTDPSFLELHNDKVCQDYNEEQCNNSDTCELEMGECQSKIGNALRKNHGKHLFGKCNSQVIMDFENICEKLNIPIYSSSTTRFFSSYKCNAKDVVRRFKYCISKGVDLLAGEVCDERLIQAQAMNTINQALTMQISNDEWYSLMLNSKTQKKQAAVSALEGSQGIEASDLINQELDALEFTLEVARLEEDIALVLNQTERKRELINKMNVTRQCILWNMGNAEQTALKKQSIVRDPFNSGVDITNNSNRIKQINEKCNSYEEPFPKKLIFGFAFIIIIILLFVLFKR